MGDPRGGVLGEQRLDRRQFLWLAAAGAVSAATAGAACGSGSKDRGTTAAKASGPGGGERMLRIA
ncbi:MAG TPA: hypothetical protein VG795_06960, partial [Acidimicrobiia bacterium]|nr:hypothetical protein [Acidimicrobiia bacterium]